MFVALIGIFLMGLGAHEFAAPPTGAHGCQIVRVDARQTLGQQQYEAFLKTGGPHIAGGVTSTQLVGRAGDVQKIQVCREGK